MIFTSETPGTVFNKLILACGTTTKKKKKKKKTENKHKKNNKVHSNDQLKMSNKKQNAQILKARNRFLLIII